MTIFHIFLFVFLLHLSKSQSEFGKLEVVSDLLPQDCFDLNMNYDSADGLPQCVDFGTTQNGEFIIYVTNTLKTTWTGRGLHHLLGEHHVQRHNI
jgi:hypothetical protein